MTENQNSNGTGEQASSTPNDDEWAAFAAEHEDELADIASSRQAKRFEKQAKRKEALINASDLKSSAFVHGSGPRDFTGSSWLNTDTVMDQYGDDFTEPNPQLGHMRFSKLICWILLIVGIFGIIATVFLPAYATILGTLFGLCALIGGAGLIIQHKGYSETRDDLFDDGARV